MGKIVFYCCAVFMCLITLIVIVSFFEKTGFRNGGVVYGKEYVEPNDYYDGFIKLSEEPKYILKVKGDDSSVGRCSVDSITFMNAEILKRVTIKK